MDVQSSSPLYPSPHYLNSTACAHTDPSKNAMILFVHARVCVGHPTGGLAGKWLMWARVDALTRVTHLPHFTGPLRSAIDLTNDSRQLVCVSAGVPIHLLNDSIVTIPCSPHCLTDVRATTASALSPQVTRRDGTTNTCNCSHSLAQSSRDGIN